MNRVKKIVSLTVLKRKIAYYRKRKKRIVFTNGCFDILHFGHVNYLQKAKGKDRILIVGLNSDKSVRSIKGPQRPINSQAHRAALLAALECVDYVTIFHEDDPLKVITYLKPDILVKGADWKNKKVIGSDVVKAYGGKVQYIQFVPNQSTTKIIRKIAQACKK